MKNHILLDIKNQTITPSQSKTNVIHMFTVPQSYQSLEITYSYSPKKVEDLEICKRHIITGIEQYVLDEIPEGETISIKQKFLDNWIEHVPLMNHVTLSLDANESYIGAAHRHDSNQRHIISPEFSSPGFIKTPIHLGQWRIILNVHAALTIMHYDLKVIGNVGEL